MGPFSAASSLLWGCFCWTLMESRLEPWLMWGQMWSDSGQRGRTSRCRLRNENEPTEGGLRAGWCEIENEKSQSPLDFVIANKRGSTPASVPAEGSAVPAAMLAG